MASRSEGPTQASELFPKPGVKPVWLVRTRGDFGGDQMPFWEKAGWARFARRVELTSEKPADCSELGGLLFAEWVDGSSSRRIMPNPEKPGALQLVTVTEAETEPDQSGASVARFWRETVLIAGAKVAAGKWLTFHVYLAEDGEGSVRRAFDAFWGFAQERTNGA